MNDGTIRTCPNHCFVYELGAICGGNGPDGCVSDCQVGYECRDLTHFPFCADLLSEDCTCTHARKVDDSGLEWCKSINIGGETANAVLRCVSESIDAPQTCADRSSRDDCESENPANGFPISKTCKWDSDGNNHDTTGVCRNVYDFCCSEFHPHDGC